MADVLSGGPAPGPARPRRWVAVTGAVVLAAAAALYAARSGGEQEDAAPSPSPTPPAATGAEPSLTAAPPVPTPAGLSGVVSVAVGLRHAYALGVRCDASSVQACAYLLYRRELGGGATWTLLPLRMETRTTVGVFPTVAVSGDDVVTVVESPSGRVLSSAGGAAFTTRRLAAGPAVDAVAPDGLVCTPCTGPVTVLEPATGQLRPLRTQPAFRGRPLRSVQQRGRVLWAVATGGADTLTAVSVDRGRTWRTTPVPIAADAGDVQLVVGPGGSAYLLRLALGTGGPSRLVGAWAVDAPFRGWTRLPGPLPRGMRSALAGDRGLVLTDYGGTVWQLGADDRFTALPDPGPTRPAELAAAGGRLLVATPRGGVPDLLVLTSADGGSTWRTERL